MWRGLRSPGKNGEPDSMAYMMYAGEQVGSQAEVAGKRVSSVLVNEEREIHLQHRERARPCMPLPPLQMIIVDVTVLLGPKM